MKKLFVTLLVALLAIPAMNAQDGSTFIPLNYNAVKKKADKSDLEIQDEKKSLKANTWFKRGEIFQDVFMLGLEEISEGSPTTAVKLLYKEPLSIETEEKDGNQQETYIYEHIKYTFLNGNLQDYEKINPINDDPLKVAMEAYFKVLELDEDGKLEEKVKTNLNTIKDQLKRDGVNDYYKGNYKAALNCFENVLEVNNQSVFAGEFDTIMVQYSGIISREVASKTDDKELYKKAIKYYEELAAVNYGGPNTYLQIKMDYFAIGDTLAGLEALKEGFTKYPDSINVIANIADTYILLGQFDEGIEFMDQAIANNPNIAETYYWKGRLLINKEEVEFIDQAIEAYQKAGELDPTIYYIWYDMGYIYYLQGADFYERSNVEEHEATREELLKLGKEKYAEAIPALEKAYELNNDNPSVKYETLDILQRIYYKEQMMDQYERVKELKNNL